MKKLLLAILCILLSASIASADYRRVIARKNVSGGTGCFGDANCVALWSLEEATAADRVDSVYSMTLTNTSTGSGVTQSADQQEGTYSADFEYGNSESLSMTDANLDSSFPLKSGGTGTFSVTFWYKKESSVGFESVVGKFDTGSDRSFVYFDNNSAVNFYIGYNNGDSAELLNSSITTVNGRWYHVGLTYDNSDKSWKLRIWDDTAGANHANQSGTATNNIFISGPSFAIGASYSAGALSRYYDGLIDEVAVFDDILTIDEIDCIRAGTYTGGSCP